MRTVSLNAASVDVKNDITSRITQFNLGLNAIIKILDEDPLRKLAEERSCDELINLLKYIEELKAKGYVRLSGNSLVFNSTDELIFPEFKYSNDELQHIKTRCHSRENEANDIVCLTYMAEEMNVIRKYIGKTNNAILLPYSSSLKNACKDVFRGIDMIAHEYEKLDKEIASEEKISRPVTLQAEYLELYNNINSHRENVKQNAKLILIDKSTDDDPQALFVLACNTLRLDKSEYFYAFYTGESISDRNRWSSLNPFRIIDDGIDALADLIARGVSNATRQREIQKAIFQLEKSARFFPEAAFLLGEIYRRGYPGIKIDFQKSIELHRRAAKWIHPGSLYRLGMICLRGEHGHKQNNVYAYRLIKEAAEKNHAPALLWKSQLETHGIGTEKDEMQGIISLLRGLIILYPAFINCSTMSQDMLYHLTYHENYKNIGLDFDEDISSLDLLQDPQSVRSSREIFADLGQESGMSVIVGLKISAKISNLSEEKNFDDNNLDSVLKYFDYFMLLPDSIAWFNKYMGNDRNIGYIISRFMKAGYDSSQAMMLAEFKEHSPQPLHRTLEIDQEKTGMSSVHSKPTIDFVFEAQKNDAIVLDVNDETVIAERKNSFS